MYKLITQSNYYKEDLLEVIARNREKDLNKIKNPSISETIHYSNLCKIENAVNATLHYSKKYTKVGIVVDSDADGYTSASELFSYLEINFPSFDLLYYIHPEKEHGITDDVVKWCLDNNIELLYTPDAGSNDFENHKTLAEQNILVIAIDHHEVSGEPTHAIVINSQLSQTYDNKQFSGVGIVYKFLQALDEALNIQDADNYLDLVAVGNIADSMDISEPETRYYVYEGLKKLKNPLLKEMIFQFIGKWDKVNPQSLSYDLIPKINGCIRFGTMEEKEDLFEAMIGHNEGVMYENTKARNEKNKWETFLQKATRQAKNAHSRQNTAKKKWLGVLKERIEEENLNSGAIIAVTIAKKEKFNSTLTGLVASSLVDVYSKPVLVLREIGEELIGSLRGYDPMSLDTKALLEKTGLFNWLQGHANACGVSINKDKLPLLKDEFMKYVSFSTEQKEMLVDFVLSEQQMGRFIIENIHSHKKYWTKGFEEPMFAITDLNVDFNTVKVSSGGKVDWEINGVTYTQFTTSKELANLAGTSQKAIMDVVGVASVNEFQGKTTYQFEVKEYKIKHIEEFTKKGFGFIF